MANAFNTLNATNYVMPRIGKTIGIIAETLAFFKNVEQDITSDFATAGNTVQFPVSANLTTRAITPSNVSPELIGVTPTSVSCTLNEFVGTPFSLTADDLNKMYLDTDFVPKQMQEAARFTAKYLNETVQAQYKNVPYAVGTPGTNIFDTNLNTIAAAKLSLDNTLAENDGRALVISNTSNYGANTLGNLIQAYQRGSADPLNTGNPGVLQGFNIQRDSTVLTHTAGTATGTLINDASVAVGDTSVPIDGGTGTFVVGDIFTVAGDTQTYVVTTAVPDASSGTLNFYPAAKVAWANNAAVTRKATAVQNMGFTRGAFGLAMRQPRNPDGAMNKCIPFRDEGRPGETGMEFFLNVYPGSFAVTYEIGVLFGAVTLRPEKAVRVMG